MKNKTFILCALVALTLGTPSCGKKKDKTTPEAAPKPEAAETKPSGPVVVKGFYIGMPVAELKQAIQKSLAGFTADTSMSSSSEWVYNAPRNVVIAFTDNYSNHRYDVSMAGTVGLDVEQGKLVKIWFGSLALDYLFSAKDLNVEEFTKKFADSYHVPDFTYRQLPDNSSAWVWDSTAPDGTLIRVSTDKFLSLSQGSSGGSFN